MKNTQIKLRQRPAREIDDNTFSIVHAETPELADGDIQVAAKFISIDPAMRPWIHDVANYLPPVEIGAVMRAGSVGEVIKSRNSGFRVGDFVHGTFGVQSVYTGPPINASVLDTTIAPIEDFLGGLGGTGLAAYFGLLKVGALAHGETVLLSAAGGAVGHVAVQIAKIKGARVVGIAGGTEKCRRVIEEFGADACIDYRSDNVSERVRALCPDGIDIYFDNVGAEILEIALDNLAMRARIVICGAISEYNNFNDVHAPRNYLNLIGTGARMEGLLNMHWVDHYADARAEMGRWKKAGALKFLQQVEVGIENFPKALQMLFAGKNTGKMLIRV